MPLTDIAVRRAASRERAYRLTDGGGMYLEIAPSGGKYWRLKYRFRGRDRRLALGVYPDVSRARSEARRVNNWRPGLTQATSKRLIGVLQDSAPTIRSRP